ncbi:hypothetical protein ABH922_003573 [Rhodococcus sp. 27YEA15]
MSYDETALEAARLSSRGGRRRAELNVSVPEPGERIWFGAAESNSEIYGVQREIVVGENIAGQGQLV